ncbi:calponin homology domain-containing protein DDB_G0272472-like isoform X2 [Diorhabda carinulata]|nr:calponin homology domain-containing protein DDB_G0272472-like isoform X2 [Diorhabda carinulata]
MRKEQEEIRKVFVEKANKKIFMNKGNAKQLTSAYILSEVLYEREKQKEFKDFLMKHEAEEYAKEVEDVRRVAKEFAEETKAHNENEKRKKIEASKQIRKELDEKIKKENEEAEKRRMEDYKDYNDALDEMNCLKRKDFETKLKKKQEIARDMEDMLEKERQKNILLATEEQELDDVIKAYRIAKDRIDCMRKIEEKQLREEAIRYREEKSETAKAVSTEKEEEEKRQRSLEEAVKEYEEKELEKERKKTELHAREVRDKLEGRRRFLEKEEERLKKEAELKKWEMLNRYKTAEAVKILDNNTANERKNKMLKYRDDLLKQIAENENRQKKEKEIDRMIMESLNRTDDDKFFAYADEILNKQTNTKRSTYPTIKAIMDYKKNNHLST